MAFVEDFLLLGHADAAPAVAHGEAKRRTPRALGSRAVLISADELDGEGDVRHGLVRDKLLSDAGVREGVLLGIEQQIGIW